MSPMFFPLSPSVCQCSHPCIPLVISPVGRPHMFLVLSSVSVHLVCVPFTPCLVNVLVSLCLCPCSSSCACSCLFLVPPRYVFLDLGFAFCIFDLNFSFCLYFVLLFLLLLCLLTALNFCIHFLF